MSGTISIYHWKGPGNYDLFYGLPDWAQAIAEEHSQFFSGIERNIFGKYNYYLVSSTERIITPLPFLALAFGGQYNNDPPYTNAENGFFPSLNEIIQYDFQLFSFRLMELDYLKRKAHAENSQTAYKIYSISYALDIFSDKKDSYSKDKSVVRDRILHQTRMIMSLDAKKEWNLSVFFDDKSGKIIKYSIAHEGANDSHYVFVDELSVRKVIYRKDDESHYLDQILKIFIFHQGHQKLLEIISPYIKESYHF